MPEIVSVADRPRKRFDTRNGGKFWRVQLIDHPKEEVDAPEAFIIDGDPGRELRTHYHDVDQFQIITNGTGTLGRHDVCELGVHFARAFTPYGPIVSGAQGLGYLTLRARRDLLQAQYIPECRDKLNTIPDRAPWQKTILPRIPVLADGQVSALEAASGIDDGSGLSVFGLSLAPGASMKAPPPDSGSGQFVVVTKGGLVHDGALKPGMTVVYIKPEEPAFQMQAGPEGLEAMVLNFPRHMGATQQPGPVGGQDYKIWQCALCAFVYDEAAGLPEEGIAPGTRWADVPDNWGCPDCSAQKADFEMVEF